LGVIGVFVGVAGVGLFVGVTGAFVGVTVVFVVGDDDNFFLKYLRPRFSKGFVVHILYTQNWVNFQVKPLKRK